jgi:adenylate kinase
MTTPHTFVFFGIVGSGKGTQVELIQKYLKDKNPEAEFVFVSPGAEFRSLIANQSYTGNLVKDKIDKGFLQPNFLTNGLFAKSLIENMKAESLVIADGYPRTLNQSEIFEEAMKFYKRDTVHIIYIEVGRDEAIKRMKLRGRSDDTDEGIARRFDEYVNNVLPAMRYFEGKPGYTVYTINGEQSIEDVHGEIISKLAI